MKKETTLPRIYEFRTYKLHPGKLAAFKKRFAESSVPFFAKHGVKLHGFFEVGNVPANAVEERSAGGIVLPIVGTEFGQDAVSYIVSFDSAEQRDAAWRAFVVDPDWLALRRASEADGPLVADETTVVLTPADCSPMQ